MTRTITVSTDVFAAIWANRKAGEDSEEAILRRLLGCDPQASRPQTTDPDGGVRDARNGVHFPEGFEVYRTYKRREYRARAVKGAWMRDDTGQRFATLNQLNESIATGNENIWNGNWKYRDNEGKICSIDALRR